MDGSYKTSSPSTWLVDTPANEDIETGNKINVIRLEKARELMQNLSRIRDPQRRRQLLELFESKNA